MLTDKSFIVFLLKIYIHLKVKHVSCRVLYSTPLPALRPAIEITPNFPCLAYLVHVARQIFADIYQATIKKIRAFKPLLSPFIQRDICYQWNYTFHLQFTYNNRSYAFSTVADGEKILLKLGIISHNPSSQDPLRSNGPPPLLSPLWSSPSSRKYATSRRIT